MCKAIVGRFLDKAAIKEGEGAYTIVLLQVGPRILKVVPEKLCRNSNWAAAHSFISISTRSQTPRKVSIKTSVPETCFYSFFFSPTIWGYTSAIDCIHSG
ncbi:hypothetical protein L2E82_13269 [Cichorium intybus]|uniref:Uncharacterized protein n=1 Tax=Cichorium intybus TaxID=13427 RepID=A0ACB9GHU6_CICIN|nr:hypothetical protein L2E82_13269 [Cichorium intybus]